MHAQTGTNVPPSFTISASAYDQIITAGNANLKAGDFAGAHQAAMKALGLDGNRFEAYALESLALFKEGKTNEAKGFIEIALAKVPAAKKSQLEALAAAIESGNPSQQKFAPSSAPSQVDQLQGDDRLKYETLLSMLSDADKSTDLDQRHKVLEKFLNESSGFLTNYPHMAHLWVARVAVAVELNRVHDGWKAGQKIKALGLENSNDPRVQKVIIQLNEKGWLTESDPYLGPTEGKNWTISNLNLDMIWVQPGTFTMGSPPNEKGRRDDETQHEVTLSKGYWLGKFEVTLAQWRQIMGSIPVDDDVAQDSGGEHGPVWYVSWSDAMDFCHKLTIQADAAGLLPEGYVYTLPTEAQWEYACRAGKTGRYGGDGILKDMGWHFGFFSSSHIHPVGEKQPNDWGFYDMHGNVAEWCYDWYGPYPTTAVTDPTGPTAGPSHCCRGADLSGWADDCRSACREYIKFVNDGYVTGQRGGEGSICIGFRIALAPIITNNER
jgi:formylglycine-generating enzyme required for sulfatase activity